MVIYEADFCLPFDNGTFHLYSLDEEQYVTFSRFSWDEKDGVQEPASVEEFVEAFEDLWEREGWSLPGFWKFLNNRKVWLFYLEAIGW